MKQHTIAEAVSCTGTGARTGKPVYLNLAPAPPDTGVVFEWVRGGAPADPDPRRADRAAEPLRAALFGLGIDNVRVAVEGPELPLMDGSAAPYVFLLRSAGVLAQPAARRVLRLRRAIEIRDGARAVRVEPARSLRIDYAVEVDHPAIGRQAYRLDASDPRRFERELAGARGFAFRRETPCELGRVEDAAGFGEDTVLLDDEGVVNPDGLRWPDEFVRHRVQALLGDLGRLGVAVHARIRIERGGRTLHRRLVEAIAASPEARRLAGIPRGDVLRPPIAAPAPA